MTNIIKKTANITLSILLGCALYSCGIDGLMDKEELDPNAPEVVFQDKNMIEKALTHLYSKIWFSTSHGGFNCFSALGAPGLLDLATDDAASPSNIDYSIPFRTASLSASAAPFWAGNPWTIYYKAIRSANVFREGIIESPITDDEKESMSEQARLLRAIYYHELFRFYGALVIINDDIADPMSTNFTRLDLDATVSYIIAEFDAVINNGLLPEAQWSGADFGRVTLGMAHAYKARTLLYYASPLNNPENIVQRWVDAASASKTLIGKGWYSLFTLGTPGQSFAEFFNTRSNTEVISSRQRGKSTTMYQNLPPGDPWNSGTTWPGTVVTMNAVDAFSMKNGKSPISGYNSDNSPIVNVGSGYDDSRPFLDRDPRLDMTVIRHKSQWKVKGENREMDIRIHMPTQMGVTNICIRKFLDKGYDHLDGTGGIDMNYPLLRYAEVLLNFAEAKNESEAAPTAVTVQEILSALNLIRDRAGADDLPSNGFGGAWTQASLRAIIKQERRMELMLEGHRFYDPRRWKEAHINFNGAIYAMDVDENGVMSRRISQNRIFSDKLYRLPVPSREVNGTGGKIWQNPGW